MAEIFNFYVQDNRTILFPRNNLLEPIMQEDHKVATWRFRIPKILNQIDMSGWSWWFVYVNAKGQEYSELLTLTNDIDEPSSYSTADYDIDYGISKFPGSFSFALEAISAQQGGEIDGEWHTKTYKHKVDSTLQGNQAEYAETESDVISALMQEVRNKVNQLVGGATPLPVNLKSLMTDHDKVYLYTGSEPNESTGYWYYWNGTQFVPGGLYGAGVLIDPTLTQSGQAADAKKTGDEITGLKEDFNELLIPLELVAMYDGKILRKTGMQDYADYAVYQYAIPDNVPSVHIKTNFYGNVFIIFTDMATDGDFTSGPYQAYPTSGYPTSTTVDDDYNTKGFKYVWIPLYKKSGVTVSAKMSFVQIVENVRINTIIANNTTGEITDLNAAERNHIYVFTSRISNISNYPPIPNGGTLLCYAAYNIDNIQLFVSNQNAIYIRRMWGTTWGTWKQIPTADNVQNVVDTAINTAFSGYYSYNILSGFKNITCIGDSLTYSQVYTGASTSRQAYQPYPTILAKRCGATETILATPGDTPLQAWNRNGNNIIQRDAQLTIVYLGTNGGLTDTIDADMVGDDYTQWADTNTGAYGKIIAKSIAVGSRVVLVKVHSSSGGVAVTNTVIEKMAERFNVPVIENTYLSGTKYHSWPNGNGTNGTHYNDFGYSVFADQVANSVSHLSAEDAVKIIPV